MRIALLLAALLLGASARADLATGSASPGDWGHVTVALTRSGEAARELVFALYDSGRILYLDGLDYDVVRLTANEQKSLVGDLGWRNAPPAMQKIWKRQYGTVSAHRTATEWTTRRRSSPRPIRCPGRRYRTAAR